jgi:hypothetical protein
MKEPLSPPIQLPIPYHRRAKAWAALKGLSLRDGICQLIDNAWAELPKGACPPEAKEGRQTP